VNLIFGDILGAVYSELHDSNLSFSLYETFDLSHDLHQWDFLELSNRSVNFLLGLHFVNHRIGVFEQTENEHT